MTGARLLVVDDEPDICEFIKEAAENVGFEVAVVDHPIRFRSVYRSFSPTEIMLDLMMPGVDGVEVLRFLGAERCEAGILLLTGSNPRVVNTVKRLGGTLGLRMVAALRKPVQLDDLQAALHKVRGEARC